MIAKMETPKKKVKEVKVTQSIRLTPETLEKIKKVAPEENVSLWVRQLIEKTLKN